MTPTGEANVRVTLHVRRERDQLILTGAVHNEGSSRVYLLHRSMSDGAPQVYVMFGGAGFADVSFGLAPLELGDLPPGQHVTWRPRSAGDPIEPGASLALHARLPLPLRDPDLLTDAEPVPVATTVSRIRVILRYALAPVAPPPRTGLGRLWFRFMGRPAQPPRAPQGGFDLLGAEVAALERAIDLPEPVPFWRSPRHPDPTRPPPAR